MGLNDVTKDTRIEIAYKDKKIKWRINNKIDFENEILYSLKMIQKMLEKKEDEYSASFPL